MARWPFVRRRTLIPGPDSASSHPPLPRPRLPRRRLAARAGAAAFATLALLLAVAPAASAHATVVATSPGGGSVLASAPASVGVSFDEAVTVSADSLRVFDPAGVRVDVGGAAHAGGDAVAVRLRAGLVRGTYVVAWHVVSADSHPVQGAFTFSIGAPSATAVDPASVNPPADRVVDVLYAVARFLAFAGFAVLVGAVLFLAVCWPSGADRDEVLALVERAWALLVLGSLGSFLLQGVYGSATPLTHATHPQLMESTLKSPLGVTLTVRVAILVLLVPLRNQLYRLASAGREDRMLVVAVWSLVGAILAGTWAGADHASVGIQAPLAILADSAHLFSLACWIGGLVALAVLVLRVPRDAGETGDARETGNAGATAESGEAAAAKAAARFSQVATWSVGFIALTGVYGAWRGVGSWHALTGTTYGRLVLVKVVAFCGLLALGYLSRRLVSRVTSTPNPDTPAAPGSGAGPALRRLRRTVSVEACVAAGVLVVSALLVDTRTGRESVSGPPPAAAASASFNTQGIGGQGTLEAELTPARPGRNGLRLDLLNPAGHPYTPVELTVTLTLAARGIGPLKVPVAADGPGSYAATLDGVSLPGTWTLAVTVRSDEIDETTVRVPLTVR